MRIDTVHEVCEVSTCTFHLDPRDIERRISGRRGRDSSGLGSFHEAIGVGTQNPLATTIPIEIRNVFGRIVWIAGVRNKVVAADAKIVIEDIIIGIPLPSGAVEGLVGDTLGNGFSDEA